MNPLINSLNQVLANTYALYLKTQNYHWHVKGPQFRGLHEMFEEQYKALADAIDEIAERVRMIDGIAAATFSEFNQLKSINDGDPKASAKQMVQELADDQQQLINILRSALKAAEDHGDDGSMELLSSRIGYHQKAHWMLKATLAE